MTAVILVICSICCYVGQNFFNKLFSVSWRGEPTLATPVFSVIYGLIVGLGTLATGGFGLAPDWLTLGMGVLNGGVLFLYNLSAVNAARRGPFSFQSMMSAFGNILVPLIFSMTLWGDHLSAVSLCGIGCMLGAFVLYNAKGLRFADAQKGYGLWTLLLFLANGIYSELLSVQQRVEQGGLRQEMIVITFLTSALISLVYLAVIRKKTLREPLHLGKKELAFALASSVCAALAVNMLMITMRYVPATILYAIEGGGILIVNTILSALVLHEKVGKNRAAGILAAAAGLVLMNL